MPLTVKAVPYTGPYSNADTKLPSKGPTVEALKRALSRLGYMDWKGLDFTQAWPKGGVFDVAFRKWQRDLELPADGVYGQQTWKNIRAEKVPAGSPHAGEYALDAYAKKLIRDEWRAEHVPDEDDFRAAITQFCLAAEKNEDAWHYRQIRPIDVTVEPTQSYVVSDCSGFVIQAYHWAMVKSGLVVPDPSKQGWTGYGNTEMYENDHPRVQAPFKVGDLAHYPGHVTICRKPGTVTTAVFTSHGQEAGPLPTSVNYRSDFSYVVRPPLS